MNVEVVKGAKFLHRGALNLPAARFLQTKRFDPLPSKFVPGEVCTSFEFVIQNQNYEGR
jgi:hypothetical protein